MAKIAFYIILLLIIAIIITIISFIAYNKRLDKITKGELRDTHSNVPEPQATASVTYKAVLIALSIIAVLSISRANGMIDSMNGTINSLQSQLRSMNTDLIELKQLVEQSENLVSNLSWEITGEDLEKKTVNLKFILDLKQYSENTKVTIGLNEQEFQLTKTAPGTFSGEVTTDLFGFYEQLKVYITENGVTRVETTDFYQYLFWNVLPMPQIECNLNSKDSMGKIKCNGWYRLVYGCPERIKSVSVTYLGDGKELKTMDATAEAKEGTKINLDKDVTVSRDLSIRIVLLTTEGYKIDSQHTLTYMASPEFTDQDYERIYDAAGNLVWDNNKY